MSNPSLLVCPLCTKLLKEQSEFRLKFQDFGCTKNKDSHAYIVRVDDENNIVKYKIIILSNNEYLKILTDTRNQTTKLWSSKRSCMIISTMLNIDKPISVSELEKKLKLLCVFA